MKKRIIFATGNEGKMREIRMIMEDADTEVVSMREAGVHADITEDGSTFEENAVIKAKTVMELTGEMAMADDSGLEIDYLDGAPGVYSARFMGEDTSYEIKNAALLEKLAGVPEKDRTARFVCAIACAFPGGRILTCRETMEGIIGYESRGENGFGYDPIFFLPQCGCTSAELSLEEKNKLSHRGKALRTMRALLKGESDSAADRVEEEAGFVVSGDKEKSGSGTYENKEKSGAAAGGSKEVPGSGAHGRNEESGPAADSEKELCNG